MALEVCVGQQYDMEFETRSEIRVEEYMEMIRLKTSVLLGSSLELGALVGGATAEQAHALYAVGIELGLAFQIQDDLLDVYGDEKTFGKPIGGDIVNAKKTLLLLYTLEQLQGEDLKRLQEILTYTPEERRAYIDEVRALYDEAGTRLYAEAEIERLTSEAYHGVEQLPLREEGRELLACSSSTATHIYTERSSTRTVTRCSHAPLRLVLGRWSYPMSMQRAILASLIFAPHIPIDFSPPLACTQPMSRRTTPPSSTIWSGSSRSVLM